MVANDQLLTNYALGLWAIAFGVIQVMVLLFLVYAAVLFRRAPGRVPDEGEKVFVRALVCATVIAIAICIVLVLAFEVTRVKERWLHPILYGMPLIAALWSSWHVSARRLRAVLIVAGVCALAVIVMLPARTLLGPVIGRTNELNEPYADLAAEIRAAGFTKGAILASYNLLGGNMRFQFPDSPVVTPEYPHFALPDGGPYLLIWMASVDKRMPGRLPALFEKVTDRKLPPTTPRYVSAPMLYAPDETMRLGFAILR
jgi:hypothetical protein